jgi:hypothetical protein
MPLQFTGHFGRPSWQLSNLKRLYQETRFVTIMLIESACVQRSVEVASGSARTDSPTGTPPLRPRWLTAWGRTVISPHASPGSLSSVAPKGAGASVAIEPTVLAADTAGMAKKPEPPHLFWLTYRHPDGSAAGVVAIESRGLLHARLKAALAGADRELEFASGHQLDPVSAQLIVANMIGRFLDDCNLRRLHQRLIK